MYTDTFAMPHDADLWTVHDGSRPDEDVLTEEWIEKHLEFLDAQLPRLLEHGVLDLQGLQATDIPGYALFTYLDEYVDKHIGNLEITIILPTTLQVAHDYAFHNTLAEGMAGYSYQVEFIVVEIVMKHCTQLRHIGRSAFERGIADGQRGIRSLAFPTGADITLAEQSFAGHPLTQIAWGSVVHILERAFCTRHERHLFGARPLTHLHLGCLDFSNTRVSFIGKHAFVQDVPCDYLRFSTDVLVTHGFRPRIIGIPTKTVVVHREALIVFCKNIIIPCIPHNSFLVQRVEYIVGLVPVSRTRLLVDVPRFMNKGNPPEEGGTLFINRVPITEFVNENPDVMLINNTYVNTYYHETVLRPHEAAHKKKNNPKYDYEPVRAATLDALFKKYPGNFGKLKGLELKGLVNLQKLLSDGTNKVPAGHHRNIQDAVASYFGTRDSTTEGALPGAEAFGAGPNGGHSSSNPPPTAARQNPVSNAGRTTLQTNLLFTANANASL